MGYAASDEARAAAIELYRTVGPLEAARRTGYSDTAIRGWAQDAGVRAPRHGHDWSAIEECSDEDAAYLAGIIDGEGSVSVAMAHHRYASTPQFTLELVVVNTNRPLIDWLQARFGGNVSEKRKHRREAHWRDCWRWRATNLQAEVILRRVRPFLIVKAGQTDLALKFRETFAEHACRFRMPTEDTLAERARLREELSALNQGSPA